MVRVPTGYPCAVGAALLALLAGCGLNAEPAAPPSASASTTPSASISAKTGLLVGDATVLDSGSGPELCLGGVATSLPPQCGGPPIDGWVWPKKGTERLNGVTWGSFFVVGGYNGNRFTFAKVVTAQQAKPSLPAEESPDFDTPCPEPAGGWQAPDPRRATSYDQEKVFALAEQLPGYGGSWVDDRGDPAQNPLTTVVNVQVTGAVAPAEQKLRAVWGGPLCVSKAQRSDKQLRRVLEEVERSRGFLSGDYSQGLVELSVIFDDGTLQRQVDDRYGSGLVRVTSALRPYAG